MRLVVVAVATAVVLVVAVCQGYSLSIGNKATPQAPVCYTDYECGILYGKGYGND